MMSLVSHTAGGTETMLTAALALLLPGFGSVWLEALMVAVLVTNATLSALAVIFSVLVDPYAIAPTVQTPDAES